jgi:SHS2 domain-containing protein
MVATELKSATYHDLRLEQRDGTWHAHVVIDV